MTNGNILLRFKMKAGKKMNEIKINEPKNKTKQHNIQKKIFSILRFLFMNI